MCGRVESNKGRVQIEANTGRLREMEKRKGIFNGGATEIKGERELEKDR